VKGDYTPSACDPSEGKQTKPANAFHSFGAFAFCSRTNAFGSVGDVFRGVMDYAPSACDPLDGSQTKPANELHSFGSFAFCSRTNAFGSVQKEKAHGQMPAGFVCG
jgi:hypothetical protein